MHRSHGFATILTSPNADTPWFRRHYYCTSLPLFKSGLNIACMITRFVCSTSPISSLFVHLQGDLQQTKSREDKVPLRLAPGAGYSIFCYGHNSSMAWRINYLVLIKCYTFQSPKSKLALKIIYPEPSFKWLLQVQNDFKTILSQNFNQDYKSEMTRKLN